MNSADLYRLGRRLVEISRAAASESKDPKLPLGDTVVLEDTLAHPDSSVSEITIRTGFAQSYISATVTRLKSSGVLETMSDPVDGRRTLVRVNERLSREIFMDRGARSVDGVVAEALSDPDSKAAERAVEMLEELVRLLLPDAARRADKVAGGRS